MGRGPSAMGKAWNNSSGYRRGVLLREYFKSDATVRKHLHKSYSELPDGFRKYLNRKVYNYFVREHDIQLESLRR